MNDAVSAVLAAVGIVAVFGGVAIVVHAYSEWVWSAPAWRAGPDAAASPAVALTDLAAAAQAAEAAAAAV